MSLFLLQSLRAFINAFTLKHFLLSSDAIYCDRKLSGVNNKDLMQWSEQENDLLTRFIEMSFVKSPQYMAQSLQNNCTVVPINLSALF